MQELIALIDCLADLLERLRFRHAFGGALANNYWGIVRATQDVHCLVLIPALTWQQLLVGAEGNSLVAVCVPVEGESLLAGHAVSDYQRFFSSAAVSQRRSAR